jgi:hypothetical protein
MDRMVGVPHVAMNPPLSRFQVYRMLPRRSWLRQRQHRGMACLRPPWSRSIWRLPCRLPTQ